MMKFTFTACLLLILSLFSAVAQETAPVVNPDKPAITWSGFVKAEANYDKRQIC